MNGGQLPTNQLHDINCGAQDASSAPQLMSCITTIFCVCVCVLYSVFALFVYITDVIYYYYYVCAHTIARSSFARTIVCV